MAYKNKTHFRKDPLPKISYLDDIIDYVIGNRPQKAEKNRMKHGVKSMFDFIVSETKNKEVFSIDMSPIGVLHKSMYFIKNMPDKDYPDKELDINRIKETAETNEKYDGVRSPVAYNFARYLYRYWTFSKNPRKMTKQSDEVLAIMEYLQNKAFEKDSN